MGERLTGGTVLVKDVQPGAVGSRPRWLTNVNGTLFFAANHDDTGYELWKSDGTSDGTVLVREIDDGQSGAMPQWLTATPPLEGYATVVADPRPGRGTGAHEQLLFAASDGSSGREVWRSDGTAGGTVQVQDIAAGSGSSNPRNFTTSGSRVFFVADDGTTGPELWSARTGVLVGDARAAIEDLIDDVEALNLENGVDDGLDAKLHRAEDALTDVNANNDGSAINALEAFKNSVEAQRSGQLTEAEADELIAFANQIIDLLR